MPSLLGQNVTVDLVRTVPRNTVGWLGTFCTFRGSRMERSVHPCPPGVMEVLPAPARMERSARKHPRTGTFRPPSGRWTGTFCPRPDARVERSPAPRSQEWRAAATIRAGSTPDNRNLPLVMVGCAALLGARATTAPEESSRLGLYRAGAAGPSRPDQSASHTRSARLVRTAPSVGSLGRTCPSPTRLSVYSAGRTCLDPQTYRATMGCPCRRPSTRRRP